MLKKQETPKKKKEPNGNTRAEKYNIQNKI